MGVDPFLFDNLNTVSIIIRFSSLIPVSLCVRDHSDCNDIMHHVHYAEYMIPGLLKGIPGSLT